MPDRRISLYPADDQACGLYRITAPGLALASAGHDVIVNPWRRRHTVELQVVNRPAPIPGHPALVHDVLPIDADMVVFQRPNTERLLRIVEKIQRQGVKVGVDIDDALWEVSQRNASWVNYNDQRKGGGHWKWLLRCCRAADVVTVTTPALAEKVGPNAVVVPNFVPERFLPVGARKLADGPWDGTAVVGWAASLMTHPGDPAVTRGRVADAVRSTGSYFLSVGGKADREPAAFGFTEDELGDVADATGGVRLNEWIRATSQLDISLVPLADTVFNRSKSALKMLEGAAAGCAVLASPTPDNIRLAKRHGIGRTISSPKDWERVTANLCKDPQARYEQAAANHEAVSKQTIEGNAWRFLEAWNSAW